MMMIKKKLFQVYEDFLGAKRVQKFGCVVAIGIKVIESNNYNCSL